MMSSRTFFRYFASKEEVLVGIFHTAMNDGILSLKHIASTVSPHAALRVVLDYLASQYQQKRSSFLIRYQIAKQTPSISSLFLFAWSESEPALCDALCSHLGLETATSRNEMRFLVAIYMSALRVSMEEWLENDDNGELVPLLHGYMDRFLSLPFLS
jgi:AcrR family transcriptional regulator